MPSGVRTQWSHPQLRRSADLGAGTVVGDYLIERKLGEGGMGTVYAAIHPVIGKRVAVKVLHHELCRNELAIGRFVQEARAVNRIGHPNIVDVFGFGTTEDGRAFLAMELLTGESLAARLARTRTIPIAECCDILDEVSHALEAAHEAGIIHRDLKPDNLFLVAARKGRTNVKLLDFGIAKLSASTGPQPALETTQPGILIGTPQYIAPEQALAQPLEGSADVYALGVVAFEMLAGRPPFVSNDAVELVAKHITLRPPAPSDFDDNLPVLADELIGEMLEKDPLARPSLARVREVLERLRTAPRSDRAAQLAAKRQRPTEILDAHPANDEHQPPPDPRRRSRWWLLPVALAAMALVGKLMVPMQGASDDDTRPSPVPPRAEAASPPVAAPRVMETTGARPPAPVVQHTVETPPVAPAARSTPAPLHLGSPPVEPTVAPLTVERPPVIGQPTSRMSGAKTKYAHKARGGEPKPAEIKSVETNPVPTQPADTKPVESRRKPARPPDDDDGLRSPFDKQP